MTPGSEKKENKFSFTKIVFHERDATYADERTDKNVIENRCGTLSGIDYGNQTIYNGPQESAEKSFLSRMQRNFSTNIFSGMLFPAIRYSIPGLLVFERPPINKMIQHIDMPVDYIKDDSIKDHIHSFDIPLPWQLYIAEYNIHTMLLTKVHMYFMNESFKGCDQIMYLPPLSNFFANGALCRPYLASMEDIERYEKSLSGIMASAYDWIWNSGFNHDLVEGPLTVYSSKKSSFHDPTYVRKPATASWHRYVHPLDTINVYRTWEKRNLNNILETNWPNLSVTNLWDSEVDWFYQNAMEYPYDYANIDLPECDGLEEYAEFYPVRLHDLPKSFSIMILSVIQSSQELFMSSRKLGYYNRFAVYHNTTV